MRKQDCDRSPFSIYAIRKGGEQKQMEVKKAYEITDAKIQFVSLVDKAANLKKFLITKADDGKATFTTCGRIVKKDADNHFVTGVVYEPLTEDAHGNFMTEDEITKAAYYFAKSGNKVDLQHSFEPLEKAAVVESWIAKADFQIGDEAISKGTWLMTVEIDDPTIWDKVEKGEITGFSMGGVGVYSKEDVQLDNVEKSTTGVENEPEQNEKKGIFKRLAELLGFDVVEKGALADEYSKRQRSNNFWTAFYTLEDMLCHWDSWTGESVLESDETKIRDALSDFSEIVQNILTSGDPIAKAVGKPSEVEKAGKKISGANRAKLQGAYDQLGELLAEFADPDDDEDGKEKNGTDEPDADDKEEKDVTKAEVQQIVQDSVAAAIEKALGDQQQNEPEQQPAGGEAVTVEMVQEMVTKAVAEAVAPVLKARGVPTAMNDNGSGTEQTVEKQHYLHGIL